LNTTFQIKSKSGILQPGDCCLKKRCCKLRLAGGVKPSINMEAKGNKKITPAGIIRNEIFPIGYIQLLATSLKKPPRLIKKYKSK